MAEGSNIGSIFIDVGAEISKVAPNLNAALAAIEAFSTAATKAATFSVKADIAGLNASLNAARSLSQAFDSLKQSSQGLNETLLQATQTQRGLSGAGSAVTASFSTVGAAASALGDKLSSVSAGSGRVAESINTAGKAAEQAAASFSKSTFAASSLTSTFSSISSTAAQNLTSVQQLGTAVANTASALGGVSPAARSAVTGVAQISGTFQQATQQFQGMQASAQGLVQQLGEIGPSLLKTGAAFSSISLPILALGKEALETAGKFEQWQIAFTTLLGSAGKAKNLIEDLTNFALRTPFDIPGVVDASKKLLAFGFNAQQIIPILTVLGDTASGLGLGSEGLNRLITAFGKIRQESRVTLRDLRTFANNGVNVFEILAKQLNTTTSHIFELTKSRALDSATVVSALLAGLTQQFGGLMEQQSTTFLGALSNLRDAATKTYRDIGNVLLPVAKQLEQFAFSSLNGTQAAARGFADLSAPVQNFAIATAAALAVAGPLLVGVGGLAFALAQLNPVVFSVTAGLAVAAGGFAGLATAFPQGTKTAVEIALAIGGVTLALQGVSIASVAARVAIAAIAASGGTVGLFNTISIEAQGLATALGTKLQSAAFGATSIIGNLSSAVILAAGAFAGWKLGEWLRDNIPLIKELGEAFAEDLLNIGLFSAALNKLSGVTAASIHAQQDQATANLKLKQSLLAHNIVVDQGSLSQEQYSKKLLEAARNAGLLSAAQVTTKDSALAESTAHLALLEQYSLAKTKLKEVTEAYRLHAASSTEVIAAKNALRSAEIALHPEFDSSAGKITTLSNAHKKAADTAKELTDAYQRLGIESIKVNKADDALDTLWKTMSGSTIPANATAASVLGLAYQKSLITLPQLVAALQKYGIEANKFTQAAEQMKIALNPVDAATLALENRFGAMAKAITSTVGPTTNLRGLFISLKDDSFAVANANLAVEESIKRGRGAFSLLNQVIGDLGDQFPRVSESMRSFSRFLFQLVLPVSQFDLLNESIDGTKKALDALQTAAPGSAAVAKLSGDLDALNFELFNTKVRSDEAAASLELLGAGGIAVSSAFADLGLKSQAELQQFSNQALADYRIIAQASGQASLDSARAWLIYYDRARAAGEVFTDATEAQTIRIRAKVQGVTKDLSDSWARLGTQLTAVFSRDLSRSLTDAIFQVGKLSDAFRRMSEDVVSIIIDKIVKQGVGKLLDSLASVQGVIGKIAQSFGGISTGGLNSSADAAIAAAQKGVTPGFNGTIPPVGAGAAGSSGSAAGGAASSVGSSASGFLGIFGAITGAVSAISNVVGNFQQAHANADLTKIEGNTRYSMLYLGGRGDQGILGVLFKINEELAFGVATKALEQIRDAAIGKGFGSGASGDSQVAGSFFSFGLKDLDLIQNSTFYSLLKLEKTVDLLSGINAGILNIAGRIADSLTIAPNFSPALAGAGASITNNNSVVNYNTNVYVDSALVSGNPDVKQSASDLVKYLRLKNGGSRR